MWLFGGPKEVELGNAILETAPNCINLIGKTNLAQAVSLLSCANVVVSNDSGLMHISSALDRALLVIYGSSSPFAPPLNDKFVMLQLNLECQPCMKRVCPLGHHNCMRKIYPQQVWESVLSL